MNTEDENSFEALWRKDLDSKLRQYSMKEESSVLKNKVMEDARSFVLMNASKTKTYSGFFFLLPWLGGVAALLLLILAFGRKESQEIKRGTPVQSSQPSVPELVHWRYLGIRDGKGILQYSGKEGYEVLTFTVAEALKGAEVLECSDRKARFRTKDSREFVLYNDGRFGRGELENLNR